MTVLTFIYIGDWEMLFADDQLMDEDHRLSGTDVAHALQGVSYYKIRSWDANATKTEYDFVEHRDQIPAYLKEHGLSVLFDE